MIRIIIIIVIIQGFLMDIIAQSNFQNRHIYAPISDFYYLDILSDTDYSLKVGMYGDNYVKGEYKTDGDTLELISFEYLEDEYGLSDIDKKIVERGFSRFLIKDSFLIPLSRRELIPFSKTMLRDSMIVKEYVQNDGHVHYKLTFYSDSTFLYSTGSDTDRHSTKGSWVQTNNIIELNPDNPKNLLYWICTDNKITICENYLIGKTYDTDDNIIEFQYLIGLKPAANRVARRQHQ